MGQEKTSNLQDELEKRFLTYALSTIVSRSLPDVRDGLKPIHRRILFAMESMGMNSTSKHVKSAKIIGEVLGKYHPHGDSSTYESMVRMAQDFSMRYPLVDGKGNFGSMDGDSPAAYRYTEGRLTSITSSLASSIPATSSNVTLPIESYTTGTPLPLVMRFTRSTKFCFV